MSDDYGGLCCSGCKYWVKDNGIWCFNGWSGTDRNDGHCHLDPKTISKKGDDFCGCFERKYPKPNETNPNCPKCGHPCERCSK